MERSLKSSKHFLTLGSYNSITFGCYPNDKGAIPFPRAIFQFQSSSMVEHAAVGHKVLFNRECKSHKAKVNRRVGGSKPSSGALSIGISNRKKNKLDR